jgi:TRAP-type C4-dicarboxylate transport system substrate-binding protein
VKRALLIILSIALAASLAAGCSGSSNNTNSSNSSNSAGGGSSSPPAVCKLNFSLGDPASSIKAIFYQGLADKTREATNGGLDITIHSGGTLFSHLEVREGVISGAADMGWFCTPWAAGQYPLAEVFNLPLMYGNQKASTYAYNELYKRSPELRAEMDEIKVMHLYTGPTNQLFTKTPVTKPDDLRGFQVRTMTGAPSACLTAWGASPVLLGPGDIYEAMDKGVVQGFTFEWSGIASNTLYEVFDYAITLPFYVNPFIIMMNKDSYAKIPAEYKQAFDDIWCSEQTAYDFTEAFIADDQAGRQTALNDYGIQEIAPDLPAFKVYADQLAAEWVDAHTTPTFDAQAYFDLAMELYAEGCRLYPAG